MSLSRNKRILIPIIPLVLFIIIFISILSLTFRTTPSPESENEVSIPTPVNESITIIPTFTTTEQSNSPYHGEIILYENSPTLEKKEVLPDNTTRYTMRSDRPDRPDIFVVRGNEQNDVFTRSVSNPNNSPTLSSYIDTFGSPTQVIQGSKFYGQNAQWYIYSTMGIAFVTREGVVLEVHSFPTMNTQSYLSQYNNDILQ